MRTFEVTAHRTTTARTLQEAVDTVAAELADVAGCDPAQVKVEEVRVGDAVADVDRRRYTVIARAPGATE